MQLIPYQNTLRCRLLPCSQTCFVSSFPDQGIVGCGVKVYLAEEMTRKVDRMDYAIEEAEQKVAQIQQQLKCQLEAVREATAIVRRELERLRADAECLEKSAQACALSSLSSLLHVLIHMNSHRDPFS